MPTYQYACTNATCGNRFELVQAFTEPSVTECPVCGQVVRKVYGSVGVVFKGSGFYRTDSRNGSKGGDGADSGSADKKPGADTKSPDKEPAGTKSAGSNNSGNAKQPIPSGSSSTGPKAASS